jgi:hypothetical protein
MIYNLFLYGLSTTTAFTAVALVVVVISLSNGRTLPSFRIGLAIMEKEEWKKPFRIALDKKLDRKKF